MGGWKLMQGCTSHIAYLVITRRWLRITYVWVKIISLVIVRFS